MDELTDIDGIGDGNVDAIRELGIETPAELAESTVDTVADAKGFGTARAEDVIENAELLVDADASTTLGSEATNGTTDGAIDVDVEAKRTLLGVPDQVAYPVGDDRETATLEHRPSFRNRYHVISALCDKAEQYRRRRRLAKRLATERAIAGFCIDDRPTLDLEAWDETNLALIDEERDYRGVSRLSHITSDLRTMMDQVNDAREALNADES